MVEKNPHSAGAASPGTPQSAETSAKGVEPSTQKVPTTPDAGTSSATGTEAVTRVMDPAAEAPSNAKVPSGNAEDSVASRRLAHGLSPETTNSTDAAELRRKEKEASAEDRKRKAQRKHKARLARRAMLIALLVIIIGLIVVFWLLRWGLHDDASSIQGTWRVQGTDTVIEINDEEIALTDEVAYDYVLNPESKTLVFTFGALSGSGRYRFSLDHNMLAIDDGEFDAMGTLVTDIPWTVEAIASKLLSNQEKSPSLEAGNMVLERVE